MFFKIKSCHNLPPVSAGEKKDIIKFANLIATNSKTQVIVVKNITAAIFSKT